jgi:predicted transcriptional regulator
MPENGSGRLDRIEVLLQQLAERQTEFHEELRDLKAVIANDHERYDREMRQHLTWQVLTQEKMDSERKRLTELYETTDKRIAELVSSIGELIARIPPQNLR